MTTKKIINRLRFFRDLSRGRRARSGPFFVELDLTRRCNLKCLGCRYHSAGIKLKSLDDKVQDIPLEQVKKMY